MIEGAINTSAELNRLHAEATASVVALEQSRVHVERELEKARSVLRRVEEAQKEALGSVRRPKGRLPF
jgi:hypothetical protein